MNERTPARLFLSVLVFLLFMANCSSQQETPVDRSFVTNESFINGLYAGLKLDSEDEVFAYVFSKLKNKVTIFPSENYYYFRFPARGKMIYGTLTLFPTERDSARIGFGYAAKVEDKYRNRNYFVRGGGRTYGKEDGVTVKELAVDRFEVRFRGKTVEFTLHDPGYAIPNNARLAADEEYVGSNFDESGLRFHLIFHKKINRLFWILNEDGFVPESFAATQYGRRVVMGNRTEFMFYNDSLLSRKVLIGVSGWNVNHNNWYDGPFDQLPDNYVKAGKINMRKYIVADIGIDSAAIDQYGRYGPAHRVPVAPYTVYYSDLEMDFAQICLQIEDPTERLQCLTEQRFELPADFYENVRRRYY